MCGKIYSAIPGHQSFCRSIDQYPVKFSQSSSSRSQGSRLTYILTLDLPSQLTMSHSLTWAIITRLFFVRFWEGMLGKHHFYPEITEVDWAVSGDGWEWDGNFIMSSTNDYKWVTHMASRTWSEWLLEASEMAMWSRTQPGELPTPDLEF